MLLNVLTGNRKRSRRSRVNDIWLVAQAIQHGLELLTRNSNDFKDIPGLDLVVYEPKTYNTNLWGTKPL